MGILEELWYGNISPCERDFKKGSAYSELLGYIVRPIRAFNACSVWSML